MAFHHILVSVRNHLFLNQCVSNNIRRKLFGSYVCLKIYQYPLRSFSGHSLTLLLLGDMALDTAKALQRWSRVVTDRLLNFAR